MALTPSKKMLKARDAAEMTQIEIAEDFELSRRFWADRERGSKYVPRWLRYAVTGFLYEHGFLSEKKSK